MRGEGPVIRGWGRPQAESRIGNWEEPKESQSEGLLLISVLPAGVSWGLTQPWHVAWPRGRLTDAWH